MKTLFILAVWVTLTLLFYFVPLFFICVLFRKDTVLIKAGCSLWLTSLIAGFLGVYIFIQNGYLLF